MIGYSLKKSPPSSLWVGWTFLISLPNVWMSMSHYCFSFDWCYYISDKWWKSVMCSKLRKKKNQCIRYAYAPWCDRGLLGTCGWRRDVPWWLPGISCFEDFCKAAGAESRPPAVLETFVEDALTTDSIFPSSLTSRVRMSSSNTAIVLFRSAVCRRKKRKIKYKSVLEYTFSQWNSIPVFLITYHNQP